MKLEITKTTEVDGTWYKILKDGRTIKVFGQHFVTDEEAKTAALAEYQQMIEIAVKNILSEVIASTEIPEI
jgi:hypothetical protein